MVQNSDKATPSIPVVLILGFLGAGKTTLMLHLLKSKTLVNKRTTVLVNEFGNLSVDSSLLAAATRQAYVAIREVRNGSLFGASTHANLLREFERIAGDGRTKALLLEPTGLATPADLSALLKSKPLLDAFHKSATIVVVDALNFPKIFRSMPSASAQIRAADVILVNKIDLVDGGQLDVLDAQIRMMAPTARIYRTRHAKFPTEEVDLLGSRKTSGLGASLNDLCPGNVESCEFKTNTPVDKVKFYNFLFSNSVDILRAKGVVNFGSDSLHIEVVNGQVSSLRPHGDLVLDPAHRTAMSFVITGVKPGPFLAQVGRTLAKEESGS